MHYKKVKGILSAKNGMNLFRGCTHGCIYCDSRSKCYQINHPFSDIEIKENAIELLEDSLRKKRKKCMISTGAMTDSYMALPEISNRTREALIIIEKYGFGLTIQTKSNLILNDLDILKRINQKTKCVVQITLTTYNEELCKILEPNASTTRERFETLKVLRDNNIPTIVWFCPLLPFINDTLENMTGILNYCFQAKVKGILCYGIGLTLREGNREYFYQNLDKQFPGLKEKYINTYGLSYEITSPNNKNLMPIFYSECKKHNIMCNNNEIFTYLNHFPTKTGEQLKLF